MSEHQATAKSQSNVPEDIDRLKTFLASQGFTLVEEQDEPELFGDRRFRWTHPEMRLQLSMDRGRWFADIVPTWQYEWFGYGLEIVIDTLDEVEHFTALLTLRDAVDILEGRLDEILALASSVEGCERIEEMRRHRAHRWFGA